jgi:hypothetical protein
MPAKDLIPREYNNYLGHSMISYDNKIQLAHKHFKQLGNQMCHTLS